MAVQEISKTLNEMTGYSSVEGHKAQVAQADEALATAKAQLQRLKQNYEHTLDKHTMVREDLLGRAGFRSGGRWPMGARPQAEAVDARDGDGRWIGHGLPNSPHPVF